MLHGYWVGYQVEQEDNKALVHSEYHIAPFICTQWTLVTRLTTIAFLFSTISITQKYISTAHSKHQTCHDARKHCKWAWKSFACRCSINMSMFDFFNFPCFFFRLCTDSRMQWSCKQGTRFPILWQRHVAMDNWLGTNQMAAMVNPFRFCTLIPHVLGDEYLMKAKLFVGPVSGRFKVLFESKETDSSTISYFETSILG